MIERSRARKLFTRAWQNFFETIREELSSTSMEGVNKHRAATAALS